VCSSDLTVCQDLEGLTAIETRRVKTCQAAILIGGLAVTTETDSVIKRKIWKISPPVLCGNETGKASCGRKGERVVGSVSKNKEKNSKKTNRSAKKSAKATSSKSTKHEHVALMHQRNESTRLRARAITRHCRVAESVGACDLTGNENKLTRAHSKACVPSCHP